MHSFGRLRAINRYGLLEEFPEGFSCHPVEPVEAATEVGAEEVVAAEVTALEVVKKVLSTNLH